VGPKRCWRGELCAGRPSGQALWMTVGWYSDTGLVGLMRLVVAVGLWFGARSWSWNGGLSGERERESGGCCSFG